ncbi:MAG: hypothetical protein MUP82_01365, partial [Candidatus Marinimicrobia bacterium]|nr:hypothetical protein [Candidatus Neomarinimicrobiota bacterium]
ISQIIQFSYIITLWCASVLYIDHPPPLGVDGVVIYDISYTIFGDIWIYLTKFDKVAHAPSNTKPRRETGFIEGGRWQARTADLCRVKTA